MVCILSYQHRAYRVPVNVPALYSGVCHLYGYTPKRLHRIKAPGTKGSIEKDSHKKGSSFLKRHHPSVVPPCPTLDQNQGDSTPINKTLKLWCKSIKFCQRFPMSNDLFPFYGPFFFGVMLDIKMFCHYEGFHSIIFIDLNRYNSVSFGANFLKFSKNYIRMLSNTGALLRGFVSAYTQ